MTAHVAVADRHRRRSRHTGAARRSRHLEANIARIAKTCRDNGVGWRPHSKAHKTPEIAKLQLAAGAIGIACAKLGEAEVMAAARHSRHLHRQSDRRRAKRCAGSSRSLARAA
jgi:D-serine deaminase-like pyridoxal phosphate-dependent protein